MDQICVHFYSDQAPKVTKKQKKFCSETTSGAVATKRFTPSLGIPYLGEIGVRSKIWEPLVTPKSGLLNF